MGANHGKCSERCQNFHETNLELFINDKKYSIQPESLSPDTTLNSFIRLYAGLTGTKFMCREGGCGCCIVLLRRPNLTTKNEWRSVNSCLMSVFSCHGLQILTIEGIDGHKKGYRAVQSRLANMNGSQCGYCSPGMVMSMIGLMEEKQGQFSIKDVEKNFGGNICRCTGYRPILDAFKSLTEGADPSATGVCGDIEELPEKCFVEKDFCHPIHRNLLHFDLKHNCKWFYARNLKDILKIWEKFTNIPYMLVAGNTGHGVYRRNDNLKIFIDINNIEDMKTIVLEDNIEVGAAITLTDFIRLLKEASKFKKEFTYCYQMAKHLEKVAHPAVRNIGTIGGNLMLKHEHPEFPSDVFLLLETVGAFLTTVDASGVHRVIFIEQFMYKSMRHQVIVKISLPSLDPKKYSFLSYKIMPRAENAHAIVNAGFLFKFNSTKTVTHSARICFGGINSRFIHASNTENLLADKNLFSNETISNLMTSLSEEMKLDYILPAPSPSYRKLLALALLYRAIINLAPTCVVQDRVKSGGKELFRKISSGTQSVTGSENALVKVEAALQCSGKAMYINDLPYIRNEVWGAFVPATEVSSTILDIDVTEAMKIPGVVAFYCAKDIPGINSYMKQIYIETLEVIASEEVFCSEKVLYHSQPVGIVLAESMELALKAANLIEIRYSCTNKKKLMLTVEDVLEAEDEERIIPFDTHLEAKEHGHNVSTTITGKLKFMEQYHFYLEPQTTICIPTELGMDVHCGTHFLHFVQMAIAQVLDVPENLIRVNLERMGGSFGGKATKSAHVACAAAIACYHLRRPVRFVLSIEENMMVIGKRFPSLTSYKAEVDNMGKIQSLANTQYVNMGVSKNEFTDRSFIFKYFTALYDSATWSMNFNAVYTDVHPHTWFRAPDTLEAHAMAENIMEHISKELRLSPLDVRLVNMSQDSPMRTILPDFLTQCNFDERRTDVIIFNAENRWKKRGIAFVPMLYPILTFAPNSVLVVVHASAGSVTVCHGGIEMGQGINTKIIQIIAKTLGLSINSIKIEAANTVINANATLTAGSSTADSVGRLVIEACNTILERLEPVREKMPSATWSELVKAAVAKNISLASFVTDMNKEAMAYNVWGVTCAEIEVDMLTGDFILRRVDIAEDVGESLNPNIDVGQIEGAFVMGLGYWLQEKIIRNPETGEILTNRTWNYKPPVARDIPVDFRVTFLKGQNLPAGVVGAKGAGEPAICMSIVVIFALRNALESARQDAGLPYSFIEIGASTTKEDILLLSGTESSQFCL